jgi:hypothetical protein
MSTLDVCALARALVMALAWCAAAEAAAVCGAVRNRETGKPIAGATIAVNGLVIARTNDQGAFTIPGAVETAAGQGDTFVTVSGPDVGTRVVRLTDSWTRAAVPAVAKDCVALSVDVSPTRDGRRPSVDAMSTLGGAAVDADHDGIDDAVEDWLAERFAPIVYHAADEESFPVSVDWWLARTHLSVLDATGARRRVRSGPLSQEHLIGQAAGAGSAELTSSGSRSRTKTATFFLDDVAPPFRSGQRDDPRAWVTYVHSFGNEAGGVTLQYWRAHAFNPATVLFLDFSHGGDWEGIAVHLDASLVPGRVTFLDHTGVLDERERVEWEGTHPIVWSEPGGHASSPRAHDPSARAGVRQESWTGGNAGGLVNVGEKTHPRNGQQFIAYSGLWGSPGALFFTSGYWGPAFNETGARCADGTGAYGALRHQAAAASCAPIFITAWCDRMDGRLLDRQRECHATRDTR